MQKFQTQKPARAGHSALPDLSDIIDCYACRHCRKTIWHERMLLSCDQPGRRAGHMDVMRFVRDGRVMIRENCEALDGIHA